MASRVALRAGRTGGSNSAAKRASMAASIASVLACRPRRFGEAPGVARIDLDQRQAGRGQAALEGAVTGAGGLERNPGDPEALQPGDQGGAAPGVVGEPADLAGRVEMHLKRVFGDVDADRLR